MNRPQDPLTARAEAGDTVTVIVGDATGVTASGFVTYSLPGFVLRVRDTVTIVES